MPPLSEDVHSAEEYLALERSAHHRSEFANGRLRTVSGGRIAHNAIVGNIVIEIGRQLRGGPGAVFCNALRGKVIQTEASMYPAVVALCGPPRVEDEHEDTLLNPAVIVEVLSATTE